MEEFKKRFRVVETENREKDKAAGLVKKTIVRMLCNSDAAKITLTGDQNVVKGFTTGDIVEVRIFQKPQAEPFAEVKVSDTFWVGDNETSSIGDTHHE